MKYNAFPKKENISKVSDNVFPIVKILARSDDN